MNTLARDIRLTLIIKFLLLVILWSVCFKGAVKNTVSMQQWLYGSSVESMSKNNKNHLEGNHDSRY